MFIKSYNYADDLVLIFSDKDHENLQSIVDSTITILLEWPNKNFMKINIAKTKYIIFPNKKIPLNDDFNIAIDHRQIERVSNINYLGYIIDENLNNKDHINYMIKKIASPTGALYRSKNKLNINNKIKIFYALVNSIILYGINVWCHSNKNEKKIIERILKKNYRSIFGNSYNNQDLTNNGILNLNNTITYYDCIMAFRSIYGMVKTSLNYKIKTKNITHLRSNNAININKPLYRSSKLNNSILIRPINSFNQLPTDIKNIKSLTLFKNNLKRHLLRNQD